MFWKIHPFLVSRVNARFGSATRDWETQGNHREAKHWSPSFRFNDLDHVGFYATIRGDRIDEYNDEGIWTNSSGRLQPVILDGMPAPGAGDNATFGPTGPIDTIFGQVVPNTFSVGGSDQLAFNNKSHVAFSASFKNRGVDESNGLGIWSDRTGSLDVIVRDGDTVPDDSDGSELQLCNDYCSSANNDFNSYALNDQDQIAFRAFARRTTGEDITLPGIWAEENGELELVAMAET